MMLSGTWWGVISGRIWSRAEHHVAQADADLAGAMPGVWMNRRPSSTWPSTSGCVTGSECTFFLE